MLFRAHTARLLCALLTVAAAACDPIESVPEPADALDAPSGAANCATDAGARCFTDSAALPAADALSGEVFAGSFVVDIDGAGRLDIRHAAAPSSARPSSTTCA